MSHNDNDIWLEGWLQDAEKMDKRGENASAAVLKPSYDFCKSMGLSDEQTQQTMGLSIAMLHKLRKLQA